MEVKSTSVILTLLNGLNLVASWHALKDAPVPATGTLPTKDLPESPFVILRKKVTWHEAQTLCESMYFRLAVCPKIDDAKKLSQKIAISSQKFTPDYWTSIAKYEYGMDRRYWIGLSDLKTEGTWIWNKADDLKLDYDFWYPGQPDHDKGRPEHCVTLWNPGFYHGDHHKFNDETCTNLHYAVCEKQPPKSTVGKKPSRYG